MYLQAKGDCRWHHHELAQQYCHPDDLLSLLYWDKQNIGDS